MKQLGLIGYPLSHSFSEKYFSEKFAQEGIEGWQYALYPLDSIDDLTTLLAGEKNFAGLNVTIPYKELVIPFLDELDETAAAVQAVNTIRFVDDKLIGYNTDVLGFEASLVAFLNKEEGITIAQKALILGTGGAAKAIAYVCQRLGIAYQYVSRKASDSAISYDVITEEVLQEHELIINTTPLGMSPNISSCPDLPYECLSSKHFLFDLVYNPEKTLFLIKGEAHGAAIQNGLPMLVGQAEASWDIWNNHLN